MTQAGGAIPMAKKNGTGFPTPFNKESRCHSLELIFKIPLELHPRFANRLNLQSMLFRQREECLLVRGE